jgi:hypothetical protein
MCWSTGGAEHQATPVRRGACNLPRSGQGDAARIDDDQLTKSQRRRWQNTEAVIRWHEPNVDALQCCRRRRSKRRVAAVKQNAPSWSLSPKEATA